MRKSKVTLPLALMIIDIEPAGTERAPLGKREVIERLSSGIGVGIAMPGNNRAKAQFDTRIKHSAIPPWSRDLFVCQQSLAYQTAEQKLHLQGRPITRLEPGEGRP
ncbi:MAG: hypothetical protein D6717_02075 [Gammaproteobacteria bacterium]|nr:MAG: hypothetical protein D6717_02075 [Gammaproteobacteria bacterium]